MKAVIQFALRSYQRWISPMLPAACRFVPTCSEYAREAVELHGTVRGTWLAAARVLRCHPFSRAGYDPVPPETRSPGHSRAITFLLPSLVGADLAASANVRSNPNSRPLADGAEK
jgi:uncharacterized protein